MDLRITVVGLGLMGGSLAMSIRGFRNAHIVGVNRSEGPLRDALDRKIIDEGYAMQEIVAPKALSNSNLIIICLMPHACLDFISTYGKYIKPGCVVTDVTGVKTAVLKHAIENLPQGVDFVGGHPMAGREVSGLDAALPTLFDGCNYVITPHENNLESSIQLIRDMAFYAGAARVTISQCEHHDKMIAYTSQMAHVLASSVAMSKYLLDSKGYEGGSFRDITRVATLDADMWSDLFIMNKDALCEILAELEGNISKVRQTIEREDKDNLKAMLESSSARKEEWKNWVK